MPIDADFHIHSTLSPCGSLEMSPSAIVREARKRGLDIIAVSDHNSMDNCFYAASAGEKIGLKVLFGMEAQSREDVHFLCLFEERRNAERFAAAVYDRLPDVENNPDYFGDQVVVDEEENIVRTERKLLLNALDLGAGDLGELVLGHGGVLIPSHIEAAPYGMMAALGLIPRELTAPVFEISYQSESAEVIRTYPELASVPLVYHSDAHSLSEIGRGFTRYDTEVFSLEAIRKAGVEKRFTIHRESVYG